MNQEIDTKELQRLERFGLAVFIFVFNRDFSKILLVKRNKEKRKKYGFDWGIIGGKVEPGESLAEGALRETEEEIGIRFTSEHLKFFEFEERADRIRAYTKLYFYYVAILDEEANITINEESDEFRWFELNNLPGSMLDRNRISMILNLIDNGGKFDRR